MLIDNPDITPESVNPVTCIEHSVLEALATHIPITLEFVRLSARAFTAVAPFILTTFPIATAASQVTPAMVLSPVEAPPEPWSFSTILDCIGLDAPRFVLCLNNLPFSNPIVDLH